MPPLNIPQILGSAVQNLKAGRLADAESLCRQVLAQQPTHFDALHILGLVAKNKGEFDVAADLIGQAIATQTRPPGTPLSVDAILAASQAKPMLASAHFNRGNALQSAGRLEEAIAAFTSAVELNPNHAVAYFNMAIAQVATGQIDDAIKSYKSALILDPKNAVLRNNLGNVLSKKDLLPDAITEYQHAIVLNPAYYEAHTNLGNAYGRMKMMEEAIASFRRALEINPNYAEAHTALGFALRDLGRFEEASEAFRRSLAINPKAIAYQGLTLTGRNVADPAEFERVSNLLNRQDLSTEDRVSAEFTMARMLDEADRFDEAFAHLATANHLFKESEVAAGSRFDAAQLHRQVDEAIATFTPQFFEQRRNWGDPSELPVFIVGMPRSGTSLVEQIAASHPSVFGGGERSMIYKFFAPQPGLPIEPGTALDSPLAWDRQWIARASASCIEELRALGGEATRVIDKMPGNVFYLGFIATILPGARVIFCQRDPKDNCLSCFFEQFTKNHLLYTYDLEDCGRQYVETQRIVRHWLANLPLKMLEIQYETLVSDQEGQSRRLIDFLGLSWSDSCLTFYQTKRPVHTASSWQVRQPMYSRSVGRWKQYEQHLRGLFKILDEPQGL